MTCHYNGESYWYSYGHKTQTAAEIALEIAFSIGDIMPGECPRIESYKNKNGKTVYGIRVN